MTLVFLLRSIVDEAHRMVLSVFECNLMRIAQGICHEIRDSPYGAVCKIAGGGTRTRMTYRPRDFKSLASANSATPATNENCTVNRPKNPAGGESDAAGFGSSFFF
jgi:hypothetical protein